MAGVVEPHDLGAWRARQPQPVEDLRVLVIYTPGGMDEFFAEAGEPAKSFEVPPPADSPPDLDELLAVAARHGRPHGITDRFGLEPSGGHPPQEPVLRVDPGRGGRRTAPHSVRAR